MNAASTKVLVVDDVEESRELHGMFLRSAGYSVAYASNGAEALERAESWRPDVVVLDLGMPLMNGFEAARRMKENDRLKDIRIIVLTGYDTRAVRDEAKELGLDGVLLKPCLPRALARHIGEIGQSANG